MRCAICGAAATQQDEVSGTRFCEAHAGPLAWTDRLINVYSLALRLGGYYDFPVKVPGPLNVERAA
jgi:hypothetical protein